MKDTRAVQQIAQEQREHIIDSGIVRAVRGQYVDVLLDGTKKLVRDVIVSKSIATINVGWWVVIARVPHTNKWVALVTLESISTGSTADSSDLTAPANVTATAKPYTIELSWSGSFRNVATYEVQHNSSASESGATTLKVEGSNFFYWCAPGTTRHFRVRAVSSSFERSAWSSWVNATATTGAAYMFLGVDAAGTAPIWTAFNWTNVSGVAGAAMSHDHSTAAKGGQNLLSLVELSFNPSTELTIAAGAVTRTQVFHRIDTQGDDPTDDLDTINGGADGKLIIIRPENDARTVVVKHNTGNIWLSGKGDISLDDAGDALVLLYVNALSKWVDIGWSEGGAGGGAPADAQYLVLALDGTLSAERRFVPGDGIQAVDAGANGDYTLNIDVSDFAGAGLEDDGAENLRIAAAAAGDGLQGGGGNALAVDVSDFAGAGLEDDGAENLRIAAAAAGDGLQGGGGNALAVDVSDFVGDGLRDDGAENLAIDASQIAGTGLEDDGAENLRIAAAAAGDGLQGGGGNALAVDATVVRTSGDQSVGGIKTLTDNLLLAAEKDVYPMADGGALFTRSPNHWRLPTDHFNAFAGWEPWALYAPFDDAPSTVDVATYPSLLLLMNDNIAEDHYAYQAATSGIYARLTKGADSYVGIRLQDSGNDDNDYTELRLINGTANGTICIQIRYRVGGGLVTETPLVDNLPIAFYLLRIAKSGNNVYAYYSEDSPIASYIGMASGMTWTLARAGIIFGQRVAATATRVGLIDFVEIA